MKRNVQGDIFFVCIISSNNMNCTDAKQLRTLIAKLQLAAREANHITPLLVGIDQENGRQKPVNQRCG